MKTVLVIGDLIIDAYHYGKLAGTAPDFPTILGQHDSTKLSYGGAGLVVANLLALGQKVIFITMIGTGKYTDYTRSYKHKNLTTIFIKDPQRVTTIKERYWIGGHKLLEWHDFHTNHIGYREEQQLLFFVGKNLSKVSAVLVADYRHGLLSQKAAAKIVKLCGAASKPLLIDSQIVHATGNHVWYKGGSIFLLNQKEALHIDPMFNNALLQESLARLKKILRTKNVVIKLGIDGSAALIKNNFIRSQSHIVHAVDPVGAGDAFIAALAIGSLPPTVIDLRRANVWAALSTTIIGTEPPSITDLKAVEDSW